MLSQLKELNQWVLFGPDKVPLRSIDGKSASPTNPNDWSTFVAAQNCMVRNSAYNLGLGFVLTASDPFTCIDLDTYKIDLDTKTTPEQKATLKATHKQIFEEFNTYSELSPSGGGVHLWLRGKIDGGKRLPKSHIEVYSSAHYMTVSFKAVNNAPIESRQSQLDNLIIQMGGARNAIDVADGAAYLTDAEIIQSCWQSSIGDKFRELWEDTNGNSESDQTLMNYIAFYTDSKDQAIRVFRQSKAAQRIKDGKVKARRNDYMARTAKKAFDLKVPLLDVSAIINKYKPIVEAQINDTSDRPTKTDWHPAPGLLGDISNYIYNNAVRPVPEVATAAAVAFLSGVCGRGYNISRSGLNHYVVLLALTAGGKEGAAMGMDNIAKACTELIPSFHQFIGPSEIASPQALIKQLAKTKSFVSHFNEVGFWLQKLTHKHANSNDVALRGKLLELYSKSGYGSIVKATVYSDSAKNVPSVESPAFTLFGDSTPQEFYKAIDEGNIAEGLISRLMVIEANDERPTYNINGGKLSPDPGMVSKIVGIANHCIQLDALNQVVNVEETKDAYRYQSDYRIRCDDIIYADREAVIAQIWSRAHLKLLRLGALVAVSCNPDNPIIEVAHYEWARTVIEHGINTLTDRFNRGEIGTNTDAFELNKIVAECIRKYCRLKWEDRYEKQYGFNKPMLDARVITYRYINLHTVQHAAFRRLPNASFTLKCILEDLSKAGHIVAIDMGKYRESSRQGLAYTIVDLVGLG